MREGFGDDSAVSRYVEYGYGGFGDDGDEGDEEEEDEEEMGEYAPVLVDLHGLLAGDGVDGDGDCGRRLDGCEGEDDDDDDYDDGGGEEMDLRY